MRRGLGEELGRDLGFEREMVGGGKRWKGGGEGILHWRVLERVLWGISVVFGKEFGTWFSATRPPALERVCFAGRSLRLVCYESQERRRASLACECDLS